MGATRRRSLSLLAALALGLTGGCVSRRACCRAGVRATPVAEAAAPRAAEPTDARAPALAATAEALPPWRPLWDFDDPAASEKRFRDAIAKGEARGDATYVAIVTTQLARAQGLQGHFDEGHATLDALQARLREPSAEVRVRVLLERGRLLNSGGRKAESPALFERAWQLARREGLDALAVDAAHMLAIVLPDEQALAWSAKAMQVCEASDDPRLKGWLGPLYHNTGWTWFERGEPAKALALWEKELALRRREGAPEPLLVSRYTVARAWRALGRFQEALAEQRAVWAARSAAGLDRDGFVAEEIAENLDALGRAEEARPWFARAWKLLQKEDWLAKEEPARWAHLRARAEAKPR